MTNWHLPRNFRFAGVHCGIRPGGERGRKDVGLIVSEVPASAAGVFTQNRVRAAPVRVSQERVPRGDARGVVVCSGNANACTGAQGLADARRMAEVAAVAAGCQPQQMLVCSTGVIGRPLPMPTVEAGIREAGQNLQGSAEGLRDFALSILTTDTRIKVASQTIRLDGIEVNLTGVAKGAAMIGPNLATMLAFLLTDAAVQPEDLQGLARRAAGQTFNCVRVEGHTSTNDTLLVLANGQGKPLSGDALTRFNFAATAVCAELAREIADDAEGASHLVIIDVEGLRDHDEAMKVGRAVADSPLVKTAIFGGDPNWGRIVSAAGYAGVEFEEEHLSLWLGDLLLYQAGQPHPFNPATASAYLKNHREIHIRLRFPFGAGRCLIWTSDLTYEYIKLNADYTT